MVIPQLKEEDQTLLLRLMGNAKTLGKTAELLRKDPARQWVTPLILEKLASLRLTFERNPTQFQTTITEEIEAIMDVFERAEMVRKQMNAQALADGIALGIEQGIEKGIEKGIEQGIEKGSISGERKMLFVVLETRGLTLSDAQRVCIEACEDHGTLARWMRNAVTARDADAVFG